MIIGLVIGVMIFATLMVLCVLGASFVMWMAVDAAKQDKFWWLVLITGIPLVGAVVYYFVEKEGDYAKAPPVAEEKKEIQAEEKE